ncbi:MAG TPA: MerR family transcriptional regulator [Anaerolineales bacterium]|jgi:DNA-binding transcriptional MerR regulator
MSAYTVGELAELAGVSVRTLHYYDQIGLLPPSARTAAGYRQYRSSDLIRLQQILLYRELEMPLEAIQALLSDPAFDTTTALAEHKRRLEQRRQRLGRLIRTVDRTLNTLMEDKMTLTDEELFDGLTPEQTERYGREARALWGQQVDQTETRLRKMSKFEWEAVKEEGSRVTVLLAELMDRDPADKQVQAAIAQHYAWLENFYPVPEERYRGIGQMYAEHAEFRAFYEKVKPGLADFMRAAIEVYSDTELA